MEALEVVPVHLRELIILKAQSRKAVRRRPTGLSYSPINPKEPMETKRDIDYWTLTSPAGRFTFPKAGNRLSQCKIIRDALTNSSRQDPPKYRATPHNAVAWVYQNIGGPANHTKFTWEVV